jgi:hypothetical protein
VTEPLNDPYEFAIVARLKAMDGMGVIAQLALWDDFRATAAALKGCPVPPIEDHQTCAELYGWALKERPIEMIKVFAKHTKLRTRV